MALKNSDLEWGWLARALHWLIAIAIVWVIYLGLEQADLPRGAEKGAVRATHMSWALLLFAAMSLRLVWRWLNVTPAHPSSSPPWQRLLATIVHWGIYAAVFLQLIAGVMTIGTGGRPVPFFGIKIPLPIPESSSGHKFWEEIHEFAWKPLLALLLVHVAAALYHQFIRKTDVLKRMTTGVSR